MNREREMAMRPDGAASEHVENAEDARLLLLEHLRKRSGVDARQRNIGAETIDDERTQREPDALLQLIRLRESREVQVCCELFSRRCHSNLPVRRMKTGGPSGPPSFLNYFAAGFFFSTGGLGTMTVTDPPAFSTAALAASETPATMKATFVLELAGRHQTDAVFLAAQNAGGNERRHVDCRLRVELAGVDPRS